MKVERVNDNNLPVPSKQEGNAGYDLRCSESFTLEPWDTRKVGCGWKFAIPEGYVGLVFPRSGLGSKGLILANTVGVIDSSYRGEVIMALANAGGQNFNFNVGDRVAQMVIVPCLHVEMEEGSLDATDRGESGFGDSGVE